MYSAYRQYNSTTKCSDVDHTELPANTSHLYVGSTYWTQSICILCFIPILIRFNPNLTPLVNSLFNCIFIFI